MQILGVSIDNQKAYTCKVLLSKKERKVLNVEAFSLDDSLAVKKLLKLILNTPTIYALDSKNILMHEHLLPKKGEKLLDQMIDFQMESLTFLEPSQCITSLNKIKTVNNQLLIHSFTLAKQELQRHLQVLNSSQFDPEIITHVAPSLSSYVEFLNPVCKDAFIINIQESSITVCLLHQAVTQKYFVLQTNLLDLQKALCKDKEKSFPSLEIESFARQLDVFNLKKQTFPQLHNALQELLNQLCCCIFSMQKDFGKKPLICLGNTSSFFKLEKCIEEKCKDFIDNSNSLYNPIDWQEFSVCIGAALGYFSLVDFRKKEFFSVKKRNFLAKRNAFLTLVSSFICMGALFSFHWILNEKTTFICDYYFEQITKSSPELAQMIFQEKDLEMIALNWENSLEIFSKKNPYALTVPNVCQTLNFLFNHPLVQSLESDKIQITDINYQLEQMPLIGAMKTKAKAKLTLEFTTKNQVTAQSFAQSLQDQNFIDNTIEPNLEEKNLGFKIVFYLKSKEF